MTELEMSGGKSWRFLFSGCWGFFVGGGLLGFLGWGIELRRIQSFA